MLMLLLPAMVQSQITIQLQVPPLGLTIKPQLWNLSIVNASKNAYTARVQLVITDISNNQQVLTGSSASFPLIPGAKQFQVKDLSPVSYNTAGTVAIDPSPDGFLPTGVFNICYTLIGSGKEVLEATLAEVCETFEIEPLSPPQLITPANLEQLNVPRPNFSWLPPAPINSFNRLQYDWILVEVQPTQSAADAIQMNPPLFSKQRIELTNMQYPLAAPALDTGKTYAWRISARNNQVITAHSEIATFTVVSEKEDSNTLQKAEYYSRLHPTEEASIAICTGMLRFVYENLSNQSVLQYKIIDLSSRQRPEINTEVPYLDLKNGQNFLQINLSKTSGMKNGGYYLLEVSGKNHEKAYLKFMYRKK